MTMLPNQAPPPVTPTPATAPRTSMLTLDALAKMNASELDTLYRAATVSKSIHAADGALVGRMLAVRGIRGPFASPLRRWAASSSFIWEGKTFTATSDVRGVGHNRVQMRRLIGHQNLFPFQTLFGPSALDGKPTLLLDYDLDVNPGYIRRIHDEIREVGEGLFMGPAMWKRGDSRTLLLWFALDLRLS